ncbi:MAG: hypothetical protein Q9163_000097 [Psora crenata]
MGKIRSVSEDETAHEDGHQRRRRRDDVGDASPDNRGRERSASPDQKHRRPRRHYSSESKSPRRRRRGGPHGGDKHTVRDHSSSRSRSPSPRERRRRASRRERRRRHDENDERRSSHHRRRRSSIIKISTSTSPSLKRRYRPPSRGPSTNKSSTAAPLPSQRDAFLSQATTSQTDGRATTTKMTTNNRRSPPPEKQNPNYAPSGLLAAETNKVANTNVVLKYNEPPEARLPPASQPWRLYIFKSSDLLETLKLYERSCWLLGREKAVVDHATEHPSCSKQHAVLQFRYTEKSDEWGERKGRVKLYVIDLESANGTSVNGERVPERRYMEIKSGDVLRFGESTREYVALLPPKE